MSTNAKKRPSLGKGLSALLENANTDITTKHVPNASANQISELEIENIEANPFNPRTNFEKEALEELAQSIRIHGIIQPLTVRKLGRDRFQLISGERRFRASQLVGLKAVPCYIRVANDQTMLEMALVENIQREDLNAIEVALSYERLIEECNLTQDQLSHKVAKSRSAITNHLRLLKLPAEIQSGVKNQVISMGHARALVSAGDEKIQLQLYAQIVENQLSVRDTENWIKNLDSSDTATPTSSTLPKKKVEISPEQTQFKTWMAEQLEAKVDIAKSNTGTGKITVSFNSENDLNRIIELLFK